MATRMLRRGLPRVPGGEPWPPAGASVEVADGAAAAADAVATASASAPAADGTAPGMTAPATEPAPASDVAAPVIRATSDDAVPAPEAAPADSSASATPPAPVPAAADAGPGLAPSASDSVHAASVRVRRGLPRVPGGEPWPPATALPAPAAAPSAGTSPIPAAAAEPAASAPADAPGSAAAAAPSLSAPALSAPAASGPAASGPEAAAGAGAVRRGLPRVPGGEPWPPAGTAPILASAAPSAVPAGSTAAPAPADTSAAAAPSTAPESAASAAPAPPTVPVAAASPAPDSTAPATAAVPASDLAAPLPWTRTVWNGRAPRHVIAPAAPEGRRRPTWTQAIAVLFGAAALGVLAGAAVALVRALLSFPFMQDFLTAFPGEYEPPIPVEPGFAPWVNWAHFFNMFLIVLIIRSGLQVRTEKRPSVFWTPRNNPKGKISLNLWFHQALDILWLVNGVIFVILLFATGHWVRIVPTSWEVFPNALSAALQYLSFDWPHENGWNNYNSLQQLAYFATVFLAAPLAAVTGFRMSGMWPKRAERLSKAYPIEWARAVHFPVMLYFVAFIIAHVALVMLTGFLRNLNHMFAAQDAVTWTGFWVFIASLVVIAIAWVAARPLVLAPIAKVFGTVSGR